MRFEHWWYEAPLRLKSLFRRNKVEQELDEEFAYHVERQTELLVAEGLAPDEARRQALLALDGITQRKEECRDARKVNLIDDTLQDLRYGFRVLKKSPGFTVVAVLTLALAMGANAVVFGVLNALLLRPIDVPRAENLYSLQRTADHYGAESVPNYRDLRERNRSFEDLAGYSVTTAGFDTGDNPSRVWIHMVTANLFDVLEQQPHLGRLLHASDDRGPNSAPYVVLSYGFWQSRFQADPNVVGRVVRLNKHPFTIIGVAAKPFHGTLLFFYPDLFVPLANQEQIEGLQVLDARANRYVFQVLGHLRPGVTREQAEADVNSIGAYLSETYPKELGRIAYKVDRPTFNGDFLQRPIQAFLGAMTLLALLILVAACVNLGALFASRAADRGREVALRMALGARRNRVLRQFLAESMLISAAGAALGLCGSIALLQMLSDWQPLSRFPIHVPVHADSRVYALALALAVISGLLFGLVPTRQVSKADPYQTIKAGPTGRIGRRIALRDVLLTAQVAICALLITSSIVAVRGLHRSLNGDPGFEPRHAMLLNTVLEMAGYKSAEMPAMQEKMIRAMEAIPGVQSVGLTSTPPLDQAWSVANVYDGDATDLRPASAAARPFVFSISPEYLEAARTPLRLGRGFTWHDDPGSPPVALMNEELARRMFGSASGALGRSFKRQNGTRVQVVGVVSNGKYTNLAEEAQPAMFFPILQVPSSESWLVVRSMRDPAELSVAMRKALHDLDPALPGFLVTWEQDLEGALFTSRVATVALGVLGLLGAVLAVTGIFGMAAYSVSRRLRELGIRMALGAGWAEVLDAGIGRPLRLLAVGSISGVVLGVLLARVLAAIVYQATPRDPVVLGGVVVVMLMLGLASAWIPAQRALSLDPSKLLREE